MYSPEIPSVDSSIPVPDAMRQLLAYYLVTRSLHGRPPKWLRQVFADLESRIESDPQLQLQVMLLEHRMAELLAASDPVKQFTELTGHTL